MKHWNKISKAEECILVVAFSDISCFAQIVDGMTNLETFTLMQKYRDIAESIIIKYNGKIIKQIGDALLIVFLESKAKDAVASFKALENSINTFLSDYTKTGKLNIGATIGKVAIGLLAPDNRLDIAGKVVNEAAKLDGKGITLSKSLKQFLNT
ncbi:MAG: hypothetical protein HQ534_12380 [Armatimonadetes bacterium]|nr:hypothetical protein [Armatimonadota bacterium]